MTFLVRCETCRAKIGLAENEIQAEMMLDLHRQTPRHIRNYQKMLGSKNFAEVGGPFFPGKELPF